MVNKPNNSPTIAANGDEVFNANDFVKTSEHKELTEKVNTLCSLEGFAKTFCDKADESTRIRSKISEIFIQLINKDEPTRDSIRKLIAENDGRNIWAWLQRIGFAVYSIVLLMLGSGLKAFIEHLFTSTPK